MAALTLRVKLTLRIETPSQCHNDRSGARPALPDAVLHGVHKLRHGPSVIVLLATAGFRSLIEIPETLGPPQTAGAYAELCLADAQAVTVARAVAKGNAPGLIAALAGGAAAAYAAAAAAAAAAGARAPAAAVGAAAAPVGAGAGGAGPGAGGKAELYAQYQAAVSQAYAHAFAGAQLWLCAHACTPVLAEEAARCMQACATAAAPFAHPHSHGGAECGTCLRRWRAPGPRAQQDARWAGPAVSADAQSEAAGAEPVLIPRLNGWIHLSM